MDNISFDECLSLQKQKHVFSVYLWWYWINRFCREFMIFLLLDSFFYRGIYIHGMHIQGIKNILQKIMHHWSFLLVLNYYIWGTYSRKKYIKSLGKCQNYTFYMNNLSLAEVRCSSSTNIKAERTLRLLI